MYQKGQQPTCLPIMHTYYQDSQVTNWYPPVAKNSSPIMQTLSEDHINIQSSSNMPTICKPYQQITSMSVNPDK